MIGNYNPLVFKEYRYNTSIDYHRSKNKKFSSYLPVVIVSSSDFLERKKYSIFYIVFFIFVRISFACLSTIFRDHWRTRIGIVTSRSSTSDRVAMEILRNIARSRAIKLQFAWNLAMAVLRSRERGILKLSGFDWR